ncbi:hypothetical protein FRUB_07654 [Fimbriiglobus ruber]|uniref:Uncharacterized protein n=1 Tax=Fimbriiglobus ruber TaxID=1908690 RepID=A0A225DFW6_9BACT|nr:hypothetical protein FRUB_07654 [Fimbriiglobus ruber]
MVKVTVLRVKYMNTAHGSKPAKMNSVTQDGFHAYVSFFPAVAG